MSSNGAAWPMELVFRTASFCASGECIEVAQRDDVIIIRDSTQPHGAMIRSDAADWRRFVRDIKTSEAFL
jgi:hypothetical protein